jgi:hypothetical protein
VVKVARRKYKFHFADGTFSELEADWPPKPTWRLIDSEPMPVSVPGKLPEIVPLIKFRVFSPKRISRAGEIDVEYFEDAAG